LGEECRLGRYAQAAVPVEKYAQKSRSRPGAANDEKVILLQSVLCRFSVAAAVEWRGQSYRKWHYGGGSAGSATVSRGETGGGSGLPATRRWRDRKEGRHRLHETVVQRAVGARVGKNG